MICTDSRNDPLWAGLVSVLLHLSFLLLVWMYAPGVSGVQFGSSPSSGNALVVSFERAKEFRQKINLVSPNEDVAESSLLKETSVRVPHEPQVNDPPEPVSAPSPPPSKHWRDSKALSTDSAVTASNSVIATPSGPSGPSEQAGTLESSGPRNAYLAAIRSAILTKWGKPGADLKGCVLTIKQKIGGSVLASQIRECKLDLADRNELEAAALMAQPLPYAGYENHFSEVMELELVE